MASHQLFHFWVLGSGFLLCYSLLKFMRCDVLRFLIFVFVVEIQALQVALFHFLTYWLECHKIWFTFQPIRMRSQKAFGNDFLKCLGLVLGQYCTEFAQTGLKWKLWPWRFQKKSILIRAFLDFSRLYVTPCDPPVWTKLGHPISPPSPRSFA